jgi:hypothetical protein
MAEKKDSGYSAGYYGLAGSGFLYSLGRAARFSKPASLTISRPQGPSALSGIGTIAILSLFAAAAFVVWPWCMRNGADVGLARSISGPSLSFGSALILSDIILFFIFLAACGFLALRVPVLSLLVSGAVLYFFFKI